jgi:hypothetical protein
MSAPTNTVTSLNQVGAREDLEDVIYRVAAEATPFVSNIGKTQATGIYHEHETEALDAVNANNAQYEGDDVGTLDAANVPVRVGNYCQIFRKTYGVARTQEVVKKAGRASELNRQSVLKGLAMRRDLEARLIGNYASNAENAGVTPRHAAGALAWCVSNVSRGTGGSSGGFSGGVVSAATNGTQRNFTESLVKGVLATAFGNGGQPRQAYMGATNKQEFSTFTGIADIRANVSGENQATIYGAAEVYVSDFGAIALIPHPYGLTRDCFLADPNMWAVGVLDGIKVEELAKTGDSRKFMMTHEATLVARNEKASAVVADIQ